MSGYSPANGYTPSVVQSRNLNLSGISPTTPIQQKQLLLEDFDPVRDLIFQQEIASDYFRTLFKDVSNRSVTPRKDNFPERFVDNVAFFEYTKLPGIICDRFFSIFKKHGSGNFVEEHEFI